MALIDCVYCGKSISDSALECPKCGNKRPADKKRKEYIERRLKEKQELEDFLKQTIDCRDCSKHISIKAIFDIRINGNICPFCGCTKNIVPCYTCGEKAVLFDEEKLLFYCRDHKSIRCSKCNKIFFEINIKYWDSADYQAHDRMIAYCTDCYEKIFNKKGEKRGLLGRLFY